MHPVVHWVATQTRSQRTATMHYSSIWLISDAVRSEDCGVSISSIANENDEKRINDIQVVQSLRKGIQFKPIIIN